ncbi:MAG: cysteine desulfurase-like protein [Caldilineae bacterium]|nr:MAG: cysteine desulfurase-like protein [Caldilineae bacterium]
MKSSLFDPSYVRPLFPALSETDEKAQPLIFFDGPGGTQVPQSVIDAMSDYLRRRNANVHAPFTTSQRTDATVAAAHQAMADFLNAPSPDEIIFGPNMTTLTFAFSRALARTWQPGDEVIVTRLDHDANIAPWLALEEQGIVVRHLDFDPEDCTLRLDELGSLLNDRTRLVAVGGASNAVGTVNPIQAIVRMAHDVGAQVLVDAVHLAPHQGIDVQQLGCDFLACSVYKFYGPHVGVLWGRYDQLVRLPAYKVRPSPDLPPGKWMTGTQNHEGLAGTVAAIDYIATVGREYGSAYAAAYSGLQGRRLHLKQGLAVMQAYEQRLFAYLLDGLESIPGVRIFGITARDRLHERTPTAAIRLRDIRPEELCRRLALHGIATYAGHMYALAVIERLGLLEAGGVLRIGLSHYNTQAEVDTLLNLLSDL